MQIRHIAFLAVLTAVCGLTGCVVPPQEQVFTEANDGQTVTLVPTTPFQVKLSSNHSTGYEWHLVTLDSTVVMYTGSQYIAPTSLQVGAPGSEEWSFGTLMPGTTTLRMEYRQSGQLLDTPAAIFRLTIIVPPTGSPEYTEADNGRTVTLAAGTHFTVKLASNATTGYQWDLTSLNSAVLSYVQNRYIPPTSSIPGAGGSEEWEFTARAIGTGSLRMDYLRPSDWSGTPAQTFQLTVIVTR